MKKIVFLILSVMLAGVSVYAGTPAKVADFTLPDYNGVKHSLSDFKGAKAFVVMFIATQCPVSNAYNERMELYYRAYSYKDIMFIGINSNKQETPAEIKHHAQVNDLKFPILKDSANIVADKFGATVTPEIYVLDKNYNVLYHGRIDDSQKPENVKTSELKAALDAIVAGKQVPVKETKAFGCTIKRVD